MHREHRRAVYSRFASLGKQGIHPKVASEMLRHASVAITLDLYSHLIPNIQREPVERMDTLLSDPPSDA